MIIILVVISTLSWFKQKVSRYHLKNSTSKRPNVSGGVVVCSNDNFWRAILSGLNFRSEVVVGPTPVSHVTNLYLHILANSRTPPVNFSGVSLLRFLGWLFVFIAEKPIKLR